MQCLLGFSLDERLASRPGGDDVDNRVPKAHKRKDNTGSKGERNGYIAGVYERVDAIDRGGHLDPGLVH